MKEERPTLLGRPAAEVAGEALLAQLAEARSALVRMKDRSDGEALHDLRVALRRMRSLLGAYAPFLGSAAGKKSMRLLRDLAAATNGGRDAEVQVAWLEAQRAGLSRSQRAGLNWILRERRQTLRKEHARSRQRGTETFETIAARLASRLESLPPSTTSLSQVLPDLLGDYTAALASSLAAVSAADDVDAVHAARIRAKRLRYLLEPLRAGLPAARRAVAAFKDLQGLLGDLHDMHVLEDCLSRALDAAAMEKARRLRDLAIDGEEALLNRERRRDERVGLAELAARTRRRRDELFAAYVAAWVPTRAPELLADIRSLADSLLPSPIPVERERKYLLRGLPEKVSEATVHEIEQGWLPGRLLRERLRRVSDAEGERFYRTVKLGSGLERIEIEEEASPELFAAMWPLTEGCRIRKRRYRVAEHAVVWEIDEFLDRDLVLAEVELEASDQAVEIPGWLEAFLVREVTDEAEYVNLNLATSPGPSSDR